MMIIDIDVLVDVAGSAGSTDTLGLGLSKLLNVAIHGVELIGQMIIAMRGQC